MSFSKQLYQNFIWRIFYFISIFVLNISIARSYEASQSGWVNFISTNFALAITFGSLSLEVAVLYFGTKSTISTAKLSTFALVWSSLLSIIFFFIFKLITTKSSSIASKELLNFGATNYVIGILFTNFFMNLFLIHKQYVLPNALLGILNVLLIFLVPNLRTSIPIFDKQTFLYVYYFWYVLQAIALIIAYYIYVGKVRFEWLKKVELKQLFKYALAAILGNITFFVLTKGDFWLVDFFRTEVELGNYTNAAKLGQTLLLFSMITATTIFVNTTTQQATKPQVLQLLKISRLFLLFFTVIFIVFVGIGKIVFLKLFGKSYTMLHVTFLAMLPGVFFLSIVVLIGNYFGALNKSYVNTRNNSIGIVSIIVLDCLLLPNGNIITASLISGLGYGITMLLSLYILHKIVPFSKKELFSYQKSDFDWLHKLLKKSK